MFRKMVKAEIEGDSSNPQVWLKQVSFKPDIPSADSPDIKDIKDIKDEWKENKSKGLANHGKFGKK